MHLFKDFIVTLFGAATSFLTAFILFQIERKWDVALYSFLYFIIPTGAILAGILASCGYYFGAKIIGHRPSILLMLNILVVSIQTFFLVHYLNYESQDIRGVPLQKLMSFPDYLDEVIRNTELRGHGPAAPKPEPVGKWGYVLAALEILGFAFGGAMVYGLLALEPYCDSCACYLSRKGKRIRYFSDFGALEESINHHADSFENDDLQEAINDHATAGKKGRGHDREHQSTLDLRRCKGCGVYWVQISGKRLQNGVWVIIPGKKLQKFHEGELIKHGFVNRLEEIVPLLDHFHPPLEGRRHWESFHARWASALSDALRPLTKMPANEVGYK